jgi:hypothetical protein
VVIAMLVGRRTVDGVTQLTVNATPYHRCYFLIGNRGLLPIFAQVLQLSLLLESFAKDKKSL